MKKLLFAFTISLLLLVGCIHSQEKTSKIETIKIGWIGPLTGPSAVLGMDSITAAQIAVDEVNAAGGIQGKKIELFFEDDQYITKQSLTAYEKLVNQNKVQAIIIQTYGAVFALAERAQKDRVVLLDTMDCNTQLVESGKNTFCLATDSDSLADVLANYANTHFKKVGILAFNSDAFMPYIQEQFTKTYTGEAVVEKYAADVTDFRSILLKMKNEGVEALVLLGYDETGTAMKQAYDLEMNVPFLTTGTLTSPPLQEAAQGHAEGTVFAFWTIDKNTPEAKKFDETFAARKGRAPILDLATYPTYDGMKYLAYALQSSNQPLAEALVHVSGFKGITGASQMAMDRSVRIPEGLFRLEQGKPVKIQ
ncbi:MAG: ABC transporter substrate-binding protein [Nanoarchaeota archaeon]